MTYTHLLFDLDGTLFDFDAGETYAFHKVCDTFHIPYSDEVLSLYPVSYTHLPYMGGMEKMVPKK